ncbi:carboxypeptidase-like regulatory domain-containing protein [Falsiroseomonas sp. HW251]|uniref:carboxypeptidase-like regulatory domain-containing protein n=1 Tax=Falsiroseomonas sp. HW251 TaxID=3390998 RepID=UPI003D3141E0
MADTRRGMAGAQRPDPSRRGPPANDPRPSPGRGRLLGRVIEEAGRPVAGAQVIIASGPVHADLGMETGDDGRFDYGALEAGRYLLTVHAPGFQPSRADIRVMPDLRAETVIVLRRAGLPKGRGPAPQPEPPRDGGRGAPGGGRWVAPEAPPDPDDGWESA